MKKRKPFFKKIFWSFVMIVILYTIISASIFIRNTWEMNRLRSESTQETYFESSVREMDNRLRVASNWVHQLKINQYVRDHANSNELNYYTITQIYHELGKISSIYSDIGYMVGIHKPSEDLVITPLKTLSKDSFHKSLEIDEDEINDFMISSLQNKRVATIKYFSGESYITIVRNEIINYQMISFSFSFLKSDYFPEVQEEGEFGIISNGKLITSNDQMNALFDDLLTDEKIENLRNNNPTVEYIKHPSKRHDTHIQKSNVLNDLYYVYITPKFTLSYDILSLRNLIFIVVAILLGGFLVLFSTNRTYRPLANVVKVFQENSGNGDEVLEDELKFIEENYIATKKDNENFQKIMDDKKIRLKNAFFRNLMLGLLTKEKINNSIEEYETPFLNGSLRVVIIEFKNYLKLEEKLPRETIDLIKTELLKILREDLSKYFDLCMFELDYKRFGLIIQNKEIRIVMKALQDTFINIEEKALFSLIAAIGSVSEDNEHLRESYSEAQKLLEHRFAIPEKSISTIDDLQNIKEINFHYPLEKERLLINYVVRGNEKKSLELLKEILKENLQDRQINVEKIRQFINAIANTVSRVINLMNDYSISPLDNSNKLGKLILNKDYDLLYQYILDYFQQLIQQINKNREIEDEERKDDMIEFIHQNYHQDISLDDLEENFNLSSGYISTLFKEYTGENFKEYLSHYRVLKAKEMLKNEDYKIKDIAEKVGYNNTNSFIRVFNNYVGMTPGKYRNQQ